MYGLTKEEKKAIRAHMWPYNVHRVPTSKVGWLLNIADTVSAVRELLANQ